MKQKRKYETPVAAAELFMADNYCTSACYYIACDYGVAGGDQTFVSYAPKDLIVNGVAIPSDKRHDDYHTKRSNHSGCGWETSQVVTTDSKGRVLGLYEVNVKDYKTLDATVVLQTGKTVYWTTQVGDSRLWSHKGTITSKQSSHPNMS